MARHLTRKQFEGIQGGVQTLNDYRAGMYATNANNLASVAKSLQRKGITIRGDDLAQAQQVSDQINAYKKAYQKENRKNKTSTTLAQTQPYAWAGGVASIPSSDSTPSDTAAQAYQQLIAQAANNAPYSTASSISAPASTANVQGGKSKKKSANTLESVQESFLKWREENGYKDDRSKSDNGGAPRPSTSALDAGSESSQKQTYTSANGNKYDLTANTKNDAVKQYLKNLIDQVEKNNGGKKATEDQLNAADQLGADMGNGTKIGSFLSGSPLVDVPDSLKNQIPSLQPTQTSGQPSQKPDTAQDVKQTYTVVKTNKKAARSVETQKAKRLEDTAEKEYQKAKKAADDAQNKVDTAQKKALKKTNVRELSQQDAMNIAAYGGKLNSAYASTAQQKKLQADADKKKAIAEQKYKELQQREAETQKRLEADAQRHKDQEIRQRELIEKRNQIKAQQEKEQAFQNASKEDLAKFRDQVKAGLMNGSRFASAQDKQAQQAASDSMNGKSALIPKLGQVQKETTRRDTSKKYTAFESAMQGAGKGLTSGVEAATKPLAPIINKLSGMTADEAKKYEQIRADQDAQAKADNQAAYNIGKVAGMALNLKTAGKALDSTGIEQNIQQTLMSKGMEKNAARAAGYFLGNQAYNTVQSTVPTLINNAIEGKYNSKNPIAPLIDYANNQAEQSKGVLALGAAQGLIHGNSGGIPELDTDNVNKIVQESNNTLDQMRTEELNEEANKEVLSSTENSFRNIYKKILDGTATSDDIENMRELSNQVSKADPGSELDKKLSQYADILEKKYADREGIRTAKANIKSDAYSNNGLEDMSGVFEELRKDANKHDITSPGTARRNDDINQIREFIQKAKDGTMTKEDYENYLEFVDDQRNYLGSQDKFYQRHKGYRRGSIRAMRQGSTKEHLDYSKDADAFFDSLTKKINESVPDDVVKGGENLYTELNGLPDDYDQSVIDKLRESTQVDFLDMPDGENQGKGLEYLTDRQLWDYYTTQRDYGDDAAQELLDQYNSGVNHPKLPGSQTGGLQEPASNGKVENAVDLKDYSTANERIPEDKLTLTEKPSESIPDQTIPSTQNAGKNGKSDSEKMFDDFQEASRTGETPTEFEIRKARERAEQESAENGITRGTEEKVNSLREKYAGKTENAHPDVYTGRMVTNSIRNSAMDTDEEYQRVMDTVGKHVAQSEKTTFESADRAVNDDFEGAVKKYTSGSFGKDEGVGNAIDIDSMFITRSKLNAMARKTEDPELKEQYYQQSLQIAKNLDNAMHKSAQNMQAARKWANTADGAIAAAQGKMINSIGVKAQRTLSDASRQIVDQFNALHKINPTQDEVNGIIKTALNNCKISQDYISDDQIREIANQILQSNTEVLKNADYDRIMDQMEFMYSGADSINDKVLDKVYDLFDKAQEYNYNSKQYTDLVDKAYAELANSMNVSDSFSKKVDTLRYFAMLANPKTHIKNITGNFLFRGVTGAKDSLGAMIESAADKASRAAGGQGIERTKSILTAKDKDLVNACADDAENSVWRQLTGSKWFNSPGNKIDESMPVWADKGIGKVLNKVTSANENMLDAEDTKALVNKYKTALAGYLKANGQDRSIFSATDSESRQLLDNARTYAINQAKEATFHQDNEAAKMISAFVNYGKESNHLGAKILGNAVDTVIPFRKTPANILKSAIEYSPLEFGRVAADVAGFTKENAIGRKELAPKLIDDLSKSLTGSAMMVAGGLLAKEGILKIGSDQSDKEASFGKKTTGRVFPAVNVGDVHIDISEFMPAAAPLIYGATFVEAKNNDKEDRLQTLIDGTKAVANGVIDMSMLSGIIDIANTIRYADSNSDVVGKIAENVVYNAVGQTLPTVGRAIESTIDSTRRSTYSDKSGYKGDFEREVNYFKTKIPGLQQTGEALEKSNVPALQKIGGAMTNEPAIDAWGNVRKSAGTEWGGGAGRALQNFVLPANITKEKTDATDQELYDLHNRTGSDDVFHVMSESKDAKFTDADEKQRTLTPKEWTQYQQENGKLSKELVDGLVNSDYYKEMTDDEKVDAISNIYQYAKRKEQNKFGGSDLSGRVSKMDEAYQSGGAEGVVDYIKEQNEKSRESNDIKSAGLKENSFTKQIYEEGGTKELEKYKEVSNKLAEHGLELNEKTSGAVDVFSDKGLDTYSKIVKYNQQQNDEIRAGKKNGYDLSKGWKKEQKIDYIERQQGMSDSERGYALKSIMGMSDEAKQYAESGQYDKVWKYYTEGKGSPDYSYQQRLKKESGEIPSLDDSQIKSSAKYGRYMGLGSTIQGWDRSTGGYQKLFNSMDSDGNGRLKKAEVKAYLDAVSGYSQQEKHDIFAAMANSDWSNPY